MGMRISIAIPAYNEESYIGPCLEHILKHRTPEVLEVLVINNASTDRTGEIARGYPNVRVIDEPRKGLTRARARALAEMTGDYLAFLDADTRMPEGWLQAAAAEYAKNPRLVCLSGPYDYYDISGLQLFSLRLFWRTVPTILYWIIGYTVLGGNFIAKKSALEKIGGFDTKIEFYGEDMDIAYRLHKVGQAKWLTRFIMPTSARRLKGEGVWRTAWHYTANYLAIVFVHRPSTKEYKDIR